MALRRVWFVIVALAICILFMPLCAFAGIGFQPISPDELKMTAEPQAPGAPAVILYRQVDRDDSGNTAREDDYYRIKILTEEGRKYANIEIPFFKTNGINVVNIKARTIKPDGSIANFEGRIFEKAIAKAKGLKYMAKTFTLPDVQVGSIIEYFYTIDLSEHYVYDSHWILSDELFTRSAKFSLHPYTSNYMNVGVRWAWHGLPPGTVAPKQGPDRIIRLEASNIPAFQTEDYMPPENELKARVDFFYSDGFVEKDPVQFWQKRGRIMNRAVESFVNKRKAMEEVVSQIISPTDSPELKVRKIYNRVQQLRNTSYEPRKTEQELKREKEKEASNVEDVWKRGYGDSIDLNWLFLALVRAAGFEAYSVRASDRLNYFFNPDTMDPNKLDSDLVLVKVNGKDMFFDPGTAFTPFGMLEWEETAVPGLRLDKDGGQWIQTMLPESSASQIERKADLKVGETGDVEGKITVSYTGLEAMRRRLVERNEDDTDRKKFLEGEVNDYIPAASEVQLTNKPDWGSSSIPLVAEFHLKIPGWVSNAGRKVVLPVGFFSASEKNVFDHAQRLHPIYFEYPSEKTDDIMIAMPLGWQLGSLPPAQNVDAKAARYLLKVENDNGSLHLSRKLSIDLLLLEPKYYPALRYFFQAVRTGDEEQVLLEPIGTSGRN